MLAYLLQFHFYTMNPSGSCSQLEMHACIYVRMYVCMRVYVCMCVCECVCMYVCINV